ncbi:hypothetical protein Bca4012_067547 [Brassica carinata]
MGTYLDFTKRIATFIERSADQINFVYNNSKEVPENRRRLSIYKGIVMSRQNAGIHTTIRVCLGPVHDGTFKGGDCFSQLF